MILASSLLGNSQRLDGGAMFGNAPRALWSRWLEPDELGRVPLACRVLLIETEGTRTLFETGIGSFFEPELKDRYGVVESDHVLLSSLARLHIVENEDAASEHLGDPFSFVQTFGHTPGMLHAVVSGKSARLLFCADLIPGTAWVHVPITMGYDRYPEKLVDEKADLLAEAEREKTVLIYTHDPVVAGSRVLKGKNGRFEATEPVVDFTRWDLDLSPLPPLPS